MASFVITSYTNSFTIAKDGHVKEFQKGTLGVDTDPNHPSYIDINTTLNREELYRIDLNKDTLNVDGTTSWVDSTEVQTALRTFFFRDVTGGGGATTYDALTDTPNSKIGFGGSLIRVNPDETVHDYDSFPVLMEGDTSLEFQTMINNQDDGGIVYVMEGTISGYTNIAQTIAGDRITICGIGKPTFVGPGGNTNIFQAAFSDLNSDKIIIFRNLSFNANNGRAFLCTQTLTGKLTIFYENCEFIGNTNLASMTNQIHIQNVTNVKVQFINCRNTSNLGQTQVMTDPTRFMLFSSITTFDVAFDNCEFNYGKGSFLDLRHKTNLGQDSKVSLRNCDITATDPIPDGTGHFLTCSGGTYSGTLNVEINDCVFNYQGVDAFYLMNFAYSAGSTGSIVFNYLNNNILNWNNSLGFLTAPNIAYTETGDGTVRYNGKLVYSGNQYVQSTGILNDGEGILSVGTGGPGVATTFSITSGTGQAEANGILKNISWTTKTDVAVTNIGSSLISFISIDLNGNVVQRTTRWTPEQKRTEIVLGVVVHVNQTTVDAVNQEQSIATNAAAQVGDVLEGLGFVNLSGNKFSPFSNNLQLSCTSGVVMNRGINFYVDGTSNPHKLTLPVLNPVTALQYRMKDGTSGPLTDTVVNPNIWDDGSTYGTAPAVPTNKFTVQRIFKFTSNNVKIQPGQAVYNSLAEAKASIQIENFTTEPSIEANGFLRGYLCIQQGTTDLSDTTKVFFLDPGKFGGGFGTGGLSVSTLQNAYDNSGAPEILTDDIHGAVTIKRGTTGGDTDDILEGINAADEKRFSVTGKGQIYNQKTVNITIPTPTATDKLPLFVFDFAGEIESVKHQCESGTIDFDLIYGADPLTATTQVFGTDKQADTTITNETVFTNSTPAQGDTISFVASAMTGTPKWVKLTIVYLG